MRDLGMYENKLFSPFFLSIRTRVYPRNVHPVDEHHGEEERDGADVGKEGGGDAATDKEFEHQDPTEVRQTADQETG